MKNIVVLISGRGSNFKAIYETSIKENWAENYDLQISGVISNRPDAAGLEYATAAGLPTSIVDHKHFQNREDFERVLGDEVDKMKADIIVLAGFMRVLTPYFVSRFEGKILNIHPALLPMFPGLHTHERAIEAGVRIHGVTVHFVTAELDAGAIIGQAAVPVLSDDNAEKLAARVLKKEHILYPRAVRLVACRKVALVDGRAQMDPQTSQELAILN